MSNCSFWCCKSLKNIFPYLRCKRLLLLRGQSSDMYIGIMTNLWPLRSSRRFHRRYGKIFLYYLQHQKEQFDTNFVKIGAFLFCYPCRGLSQSSLTLDLFWPISRERNIWQIWSCGHFCSLWSQEQFDMLHDIIRTFWYFYTHRGGHFEKCPLWRKW